MFITIKYVYTSGVYLNSYIYIVTNLGRAQAHCGGTAGVAVVLRVYQGGTARVAPAPQEYCCGTAGVVVP